MNMMQLKLVFIKALSRVIPICLSEISCYNVHFQNKSLENWQGHQSMKSVIRRVVCTLHRFLQKSLDFPGSNIKSYSARPAIFFGFVSKERAWKEPSCFPHQDLMALHPTVLRCEMTVFSLKSDSLFQLPQMALNTRLSFSHYEHSVFSFWIAFLPGFKVICVHFLLESHMQQDFLQTY